MKNRLIVVTFMLALGALGGCSTPEEKAAEHIVNGNELLAEGNLIKARIEFKNALQFNQNLPAAWYGLAQINDQQQRWGRAYQILLQVRDSNPTFMDARVLLAKILLASNQLDQALEDARDILDLEPNDARSHSIMAAVQLRLGDIEASSRAVDRALALDPDNQEAILMKVSVLVARQKQVEALSFLEAALQRQPRNVAFYLSKLQIHRGLGDPAKIEQTYQTLIANFPQNITYKHALVRHHIQDSQLDKADRLLAQIVADYPDRSEEKIRYASFKNEYRSIDESIDLMKAYISENPDEYRLKFALGELYLRHDKTDDRITLYKEIIADDGLQPNGLKARNELALIYLREDRYEESRALIEEVLAEEKNNESALLLQARFYIGEGLYEDAIASLRTVLRDNPRSIKSMILLGQAQSASGAVDLAIETLDKAFEENPENPVIANPLGTNLIRANKPGRAAEVLERSIKAGNETVSALKLLIQAHLMQGDWDQAEHLAQLLATVEGEEAMTQQVLGMVYQSREQQDDSIAAYRRAHDLAPDVTEPLVALVTAYLSANRLDEARTFLVSVVEKNPGNTVALQILAQISLRDNDMKAAADYFRQTIKADPRAESAYQKLAALNLRNNQLQEAEIVLQNGLQAMPGNATLSVEQAIIHERKGDIDLAIEVYESLLESNPNLTIAINNLASLLTDYREDQASHDRARKLAAPLRDESLPQYRDTYAWAAVRSGLFLEEAVIILEDIVKNNETVGVYQYHLGEAYRQKGSSYKARLHLRRAKELAGADSPIGIQAEKSMRLISE